MQGEIAAAIWHTAGEAGLRGEMRADDRQSLPLFADPAPFCMVPQPTLIADLRSGFTFREIQ